MYQIIDKQTNQVVKTVATLQGATRAIDKLDAAYGAVRYFYRKV